MEYSKPELELVGTAEGLVLGAPGSPGEQIGGLSPSNAALFEFAE